VGITEEEAYDRWEEIKKEPVSGTSSVVRLLDDFLEWTKDRRAEEGHVPGRGP
jgi:hypothetical protein